MNSGSERWLAAPCPCAGKSLASGKRLLEEQLEELASSPPSLAELGRVKVSTPPRVWYPT